MGPCAKKRVICTLVCADGQVFSGENLCARPQPVCPRLPGEHYEKCHSVCHQLGHAEAQALQKAGAASRGAMAYISHKRVCEDCGDLLQRHGVDVYVLVPDVAPDFPIEGDLRVQSIANRRPVVGTR